MSEENKEPSQKDLLNAAKKIDDNLAKDKSKILSAVESALSAKPAKKKVKNASVTTEPKTQGDS